MPGKQAARLGDTAMDCADPVDTPTGIVVAKGTVFINGMPAAKQGDQIIGVDIHIVNIPSPAGPIPTPLPHPFSGIIDGNLISSVKIMGMPAAVVGSTATNTPPHIPQGGPFQKPPADKATILTGSPNVFIGSGSGGGSGGGGGSVSAAWDGIFNVSLPKWSAGSESTESHYLDMLFEDGEAKHVIGPKYTLTDTEDKQDNGHLTGEITKRRIPEGQGAAALSDITKLKWSVSDKLKPGVEVKLQIETVGIDDGTPVLFEIWERVEDTADKLIRRIDSATIAGDKAEAPWTYVLSDETAGIAPGGEGYAEPSYYFTAKVKAANKRSNLLACQAKLVIQVMYNNETKDPVQKEPYLLYLSTGEIRKGKTDGDGFIREENLTPRDARIVFERLPLEIGSSLELVRPDGSSVYVPVVPNVQVDKLRWSKSPVKPGTPVQMSARIANLDQGSLLVFSVFEFLEDGSHTQVFTSDETLQGEVIKVPWEYPEDYVGKSEDGTYPRFFFTVQAGGKTFGGEQESSFLCHHLDPAEIELVFDGARPGIKVELRGAQTFVEKADAAGKVTFKKIPAGEYIVKTIS